MDCNDEPETIVTDVENDKTTHIVRAGKAGPQLKEVPPSRRFTIMAQAPIS